MIQYRGVIDGGTIVQTRNGFKRADEVSTQDFIKGLGKYTPAKVRSIDSKKSKWVEIVTGVGTIKCSTDTIFQTVDGMSLAKDLNVGDRVVYALNTSNSLPTVTGKELLVDLKQMFEAKFWQEVGAEYGRTGIESTYTRHAQNLPKTLVKAFLEGMSVIPSTELNVKQIELGWAIMLKLLDREDYKQFGFELNADGTGVYIPVISVEEASRPMVAVGIGDE